MHILNKIFDGRENYLPWIKYFDISMTKTDTEDDSNDTLFRI